jgi:hypothetical protein
MALVQGQVGEVVVAEGVAGNLRQGRLSDFIMSQLHGRYFESAHRGRIFSTALVATTGTIAAGNINGAAAAASTQFALWNPNNSPIVAELLKFIVVPISGTPPAGGVGHTISPNGVPTAPGTGSPGVNHKTGTGTSFARILASAGGAALTGAGALPGGPMRLAGVTALFAAALAASGGSSLTLENIDGDIVLEPGMLWVPTWPAAGTTFLNGYSVTWLESPL